MPEKIPSIPELATAYVSGDKQSFLKGVKTLLKDEKKVAANQNTVAYLQEKLPDAKDTAWDLSQLEGVILSRNRIVKQAKVRGLVTLSTTQLAELSSMFEHDIDALEAAQQQQITISIDKYKETLSTLRAEANEYSLSHAQPYDKKVSKKKKKEMVNDITDNEKKVLDRLFTGKLKIAVFEDEQGKPVKRESVPAEQQELIHSLTYRASKVNRSSFFRFVASVDTAGKSEEDITTLIKTQDQKDYIRTGKRLEEKEIKACTQLALLMDTVRKDPTLGYVKQALLILSEMAMMYSPEEGNEQSHAVEEYATLKRYLQTTEKNTALSGRAALTNILADTDFDTTMHGGTTVKDVQIKTLYDAAIQATSVDENAGVVGSKEHPERVVANILGFLISDSRVTSLENPALAFLRNDNEKGFCDEAQEVRSNLIVGKIGPEEAEKALVTLLVKYPHVADYLRKTASMFGTSYLFEVFTKGDTFDETVMNQQKRKIDTETQFQNKEMVVIAAVVDEKLEKLGAAIQDQLADMKDPDRKGNLPYNDAQKAEMEAQLKGMQQELESPEGRKKLRIQLSNIFAMLIDGDFYGAGATGKAELFTHQNVKETISGAFDLNIGAAFLGANTYNKDFLGIVGVTYKGAVSLNKQKTISLLYGVSAGVGMDVERGIMVNKNIFLSAGPSFVLNNNAIDGFGGQSRNALSLGVSRSPLTGALAAGVSFSQNELAAIRQGQEKLLVLSEKSFTKLFKDVADGKDLPERKDFRAMVKTTYVATQTEGKTQQQSKKIQKRIDAGKRDAAMESYATHLEAAFKMYVQAISLLNKDAKLTDAEKNKLIVSFAQTLSETMVRDIVNFQIKGLKGFKVFEAGAGFAVLPVPTFVAGLSVGWYKKKTSKEDPNDMKTYKEYLNTGAKVQTLTIERNGAAENLQNREAVDVLNKTIQSGFEPGKEVLKPEELLQTILINGKSYMAIPQSFAEKITVYTALDTKQGSLAKQFLVRKNEGDKEYVLVPQNMVVGLHMLITDTTKKHILILGDTALGHKGDTLLQQGKNVLDKNSRSTIPVATDEVPANLVLNEYDVGVTRRIQKDSIETSYRSNRDKVIGNMNTELKKNNAVPLIQNVSQVVLEKPVIGEPAIKEPYLGQVSFDVVPNFEEMLTPESKTHFASLIEQDVFSYDAQNDRLTLNTLSGSIKLLYSAADNKRKVSYETNGNINVGFSYVSDAFVTSTEQNEFLIRDELPKEFISFLNTEEASRVFLTMRYGELGPDAGAKEDNEYTDYYNFMKREDYAAAKKIFIDAFTKVKSKEFQDTGVDATRMNSRLDLSGDNRSVAIAVLKQINGELSRTRTTEFKHMTMQERKAKATTLVKNLGLEDSVVPVLIEKILHEDITQKDHYTLFKEYETNLEKLLGVTYGVDHYDYHLRGGSQQAIWRFQLRCLLEPDAEIMTMRNGNFEKKIGNTAGYGASDLYGNECKAIEISARKAVITRLETSEAKVSGLYDEEVHNVDAGVVATYEPTKIGFKQVPDPRVVPGSEVNISEMLKNTPLAVRNQYYRVYLEQLLSGNEEQVRHEIDMIRDTRASVQANNPNALFSWTESDLPKPESILNIDQAKAQLKDFLLNPAFGNFSMYGASYGPCKNRFKYHRYEMKYRVEEKKDYDVPGKEVFPAKEQNIGHVGVAAYAAGSEIDANAFRINLGTLNFNIDNPGPVTTTPGQTPLGNPGNTTTDPNNIPGDTPVTVINGGPNTTVTFGGGGAQTPGVTPLGPQGTQTFGGTSTEGNTFNANIPFTADLLPGQPPILPNGKIGTTGKKKEERKKKKE